MLLEIKAGVKINTGSSNLSSALNETAKKNQLDSPIITLILEVQLVGVFHKPRPKTNGNPALQVPNHAIDESGGYGDTEPFHQLLDEILRLLPHYIFHYGPFQIRHVNAQERPQKQERSMRG